MILNDLCDPKLSIHIHALLSEKDKEHPDPLVLEDLKATIQRIKDSRIVNAAPRLPMAPELAAILRPTPPHLKGVRP